MLFLITALILATALTVGLIANHFVRPFAKTEVQGVKLELLVSPLLTLTVLLLSFVLVQAFSSYNRVRVAEGPRGQGELIFGVSIFKRFAPRSSESWPTIVIREDSQYGLRRWHLEA